MNDKNYTVIEAEKPQAFLNPELIDAQADLAAEGVWGDVFDRWYCAVQAKRKAGIPEREKVMRFVRRSVQELLPTNECASHFVYSPVVLWFCLAVLSRIAGGASRAQLIDALEIDAPEKQTDAFWNALYWNDGATACLPAMSVWLDYDIRFSDRLLKELARKLHTSVFRGRMGDPGLDACLQKWISKHTDGLLEKTASGLRFAPGAGVSVCTALYIKAAWAEPFEESMTRQGVFRGRSGNSPVDFMRGRFESDYFRGDGFIAAAKELTSGGRILFFLPDEGIAPGEIFEKEAPYRIMFGEHEGLMNDCGVVNYMVPRLNCTTDIPLTDCLRSLGVTDIFDQRSAEFSKEIKSDYSMSLSDVHQHTRLMLDEYGIEAAAVNVSNVMGIGEITPDPLELFLDRPFAFAIVNENRVPLFMGCINDI